MRRKLEMLHIGDEFDTFDNLQDAILAYEQAEFVQLYVRLSRSTESTLKRISKKVLKEDLLYSEIEYSCYHGGKKFKTTLTGARSKYGAVAKLTYWLLQIKYLICEQLYNFIHMYNITQDFSNELPL